MQEPTRMHGTLTSSQLSSATYRPVDVWPWYVVVVRPQFDTLVADGVVLWGFGAYCPQEPKRVRHKWPRKGFTWEKRPMLLGYVFVQFDAAEESWKNLTNIPGLVRVIKFDERPVRVPDYAIESVRDREAEKCGIKLPRDVAPLPCKVGQVIQITEHPAFGGLFGKVTQLLDKKGRCVVNIDLLGRLTPVEVSGDQVRVL